MIALMCFAAMTMAGGSADPPSEIADLRWLPDGERLLVERRWLFHAGSGTFTRITCRAPDGSTAGDCGTMAFAPSGERALVLAEGAFRLGRPDGPFGPRVPLPLAARASNEGATCQFAFWLSERTIFFQRIVFGGESESGPRAHCWLYDTHTREWHSPGACISAGILCLTSADRGPGRWLAVHSDMEGIAFVDFLRYDPRSGRPGGAAQSIRLDASKAWIRFTPGGLRVDLVSPCRACDGSQGAACAGPEQPELACFDPPDPEHWNLYALLLAGKGRLELVRSDLPPGAALDPRHDRFAWVREGALCIGDPRDHAPPCYALPEAEKDRKQ